VTTKTPILNLLVVLVTVVAGCEPTSQPPNAFVQEATLRQAEQSQTVAESSKQVAQTSQQFVEAESAARREVIALQQDLRSDQAELGKQRHALEVERQELDARRQSQILQERRESMFAAILTSGGIIAASLTPLLLAAASLWGLWRDIGDQAAAELLITEIEPETPRVSGRHPDASDEGRIGNEQSGADRPPALPPA
jgi:hypothetical protein